MRAVSSAAGPRALPQEANRIEWNGTERTGLDSAQQQSNFISPMGVDSALLTTVLGKHWEGIG